MSDKELDILIDEAEELEYLRDDMCPEVSPQDRVDLDYNGGLPEYMCNA